MKTPFDDAVAVLVDLAREGFSRGWDRLDRADKHDAIAVAISGVHAEWLRLTAERDAAVRECDELRKAAAWKPSEVWREEVADEVAEAIAAFIEARMVRGPGTVEGQLCRAIATDIRSGAWKDGTK